MTDFLKIAKSIAFHFAHICAYGVETGLFHSKLSQQQGQASIGMFV